MNKFFILGHTINLHLSPTKDHATLFYNKQTTQIQLYMLTLAIILSLLGSFTLRLGNLYISSQICKKNPKFMDEDNVRKYQLIRRTIGISLCMIAILVLSILLKQR